MTYWERIQDKVKELFKTIRRFSVLKVPREENRKVRASPGII
jgi:hypothetical protein